MTCISFPFFSKHKAAVAAVGLFVVSVGVFWPSLSFEFLSVDDSVQITKNPHVRSGLTKDSVRWAFQPDSFFSKIEPYTWRIPLVFLSHMLDVEIYGLNPEGHRLTNVLLHAASAAFFFLFLFRITGRLDCSLLAAALFSAHPMKVESVVWLAERKDVLSGFFVGLTLLAYANYISKPGWKLYAAILIFYTLGLMSKASIVALPLGMMAFDFWPLKRFRWGDRSTILKSFLEKIPLFILSLIAGVITMAGSTFIVTNIKPFNASHIIEISLNRCFDYLTRTIWPVNLAFLYPLTPDSLSLWRSIQAFISVVGLTAIFSAQYVKRPYLIAGWLWFLFNLIPSFGNIPVFHNHYTYLSSIGIFIAISWFLNEIMSRQRFWTYWIAGGLIFILSVSGTFYQMQFWRNSETLYQRALKVTGPNVPVHVALGNLLSDQGRLDEAERHYLEALKIQPNHPLTHLGLAKVFGFKNMWEKAAFFSKTALNLNKNLPMAHWYLGTYLYDRGEVKQAIAHYQQAIELKPDYWEAWNNLGVAMQEQGKWNEAVSCYREALKQNPHSSEAKQNLIRALSTLRLQ
ncbi:MAG: tetratricopeptide repeat protein [Elusimicrobia bacterium]|nr:tetratricopeptide repeat protein [Elusimicrobiota bacterium]